MSDTINTVVIDDGMNSTSNANSHILNSKVYNKITPWVLISLSTLYISFLIFRYGSWIFRRRRLKQLCIERQKVEKIWKKHVACLDASTAASSTIYSPIQAVLFDEERQHIQQHWSPAFSSSATLVGNAPLPSLSSNCYLNEQPSWVFEPFTVHKYNSLMLEQSNCHATLYNNDRNQMQAVYTDATIAKQCKSKKKERLAAMIINKINGNHQRKKKRQLIWQWSVAMGYCRYNHGHYMNVMVYRLLEKERKSIDGLVLADSEKHSDDGNDVSL